MEKPPKLETIESESSLELAGFQKLYREHVETLDWLTAEQKRFALEYMSANQHENWSRYNGSDVQVKSARPTPRGDLDIYLVLKDDRDGSWYDISPPVIRFPEELKSR